MVHGHLIYAFDWATGGVRALASHDGDALCPFISHEILLGIGVPVEFCASVGRDNRLLDSYLVWDSLLDLAFARNLNAFRHLDCDWDLHCHFFGDISGDGAGAGADLHGCSASAAVASIFWGSCYSDVLEDSLIRSFVNLPSLPLY